jgi:hypothetical protein
MPSKAGEVAQEVIRRLNAEITDRVFLIIQRDRDLMREYLIACDSEGHDSVNRTIGKAVKEYYKLKNADTRGKPESTLIQDFQVFK